MTNNIVAIDNSQSPFDSIRRYRADGSEFWDARELMKMMGYRNWQNFETPIKSAIENLEINGDIVDNHFLLLSVKSSGREGSTYQMTRYAAYMTALCCDGRKVEVAAAKKYFAVKTREAEVVVPVQEDEILKLKIELAKIESQKALAECQKVQAENQLLQFRHYISTALPEFQQQKILGYEIVEKVETRDRVINESGYVLNDGSTITKKELCIRLGFLKRSGSPDYPRLNHYLDKLPHVAFEDVAIVQENRQLRRDWIAELERMINDSDRQKWIGE